MKTAQTPPRQINAQGLDHIKRWEGLRLRAYLCPGGAWTIGYGHTTAAGAPAVVKGMVIDEQQAEALLLQDLQHYEAAVARLISAPLADNQFSALVSFAYNIGAAAFAKSRLPALINAGHYQAVPGELMRYVYAGGKRLEGLVNRRAAEAGLWARGDFVSSSSQRAEIRRENRLLAPEVVAPLAGSAAGLAAFTDGQGPFQWALALIMVLYAVGGAWYFIRRMRRAAL